MSGTIDGSDGRAVNALIGFDILDKNRRRIDMNGRAAYSAYKIINPTLPSTGGSRTGRTTTWTLSGIPANAAYVYIEVYPKQRHPSNPRISRPTRAATGWRCAGRCPPTAVACSCACR